MTRSIFYVSIILETASLALGYSSSEWNYLSLGFIVIGAFWIFAQWRGWRWFNNLGLVSFIIAAAFGILLELNVGWMFAGVLFSLIAWDLAAFQLRMKLAAAESAPVLEKHHLIRLGLLAVCAVLVALLPMTARWKFGFGGLVLLAFVAALGFAQLVIWIRQK